jgi:Zn-dependent protease
MTMLFNLSLPELLIRLLTLLIAFSVHEFAHAWTANQFGDDTPRLNGRLTLNPLAHLDLIGSLMLILSGFGWAKPVPINPYALRRRSPAAVMFVSAAGPLSNLLLAIIASLPFKMGVLSPFSASGSSIFDLSTFLSGFIFINLILLFFNLVPLFPLDGEKVLEYFLPPGAQDTLVRLRPYGPIMLMLLLFILPMIGFNVFAWLVEWPSQRIYSMLVF